MRRIALITLVVVVPFFFICCNPNTASNTAKSAPPTKKMDEQAPGYKLLYIESYNEAKEESVCRFVEESETIKAVLKWIESVQKNCPPPPKREVELPYEPETQLSFFKNPKVAEDKEVFDKQYHNLRDDYLYIYEGILETQERKIKITDALALYEILGLEFPAAEKDKRILEIKTHKLNWKNYDGKGDPLKAEYYIDDIKLGTGKKGIAELKRIIAKMREGSGVIIIPYYEGKRAYPFDAEEMAKYSEKYRVYLGIPESK